MSLSVIHVIGGGDTGGAMAHVLPLASALGDAGCRVRLLCMGPGDLVEAAAARHIPVEVLPMTSPWDARVLGPLHARLGLGGFDVVHTHGMRANLPVRLLWPWVVRRAPTDRRPCLFTTVHSRLTLDYQDRWKARAYGVLDHLSLRVVDRVVYVSADLRDRRARSDPEGRAIVVRSGLDLSRLVDFPSGIDLPGGEGADVGLGHVAARPSPDIALRVWRGDPPGPGVLRVGTVARLVAVKDLELLLEVAARLRRAGLPVRVAVIGDGPERGALESLAAELDLGGVVTFAGDVRPGYEAVRELDVFVLTSRSEGFPVAVLEAMAAGVPVVATAVGGVGEAVDDHVTGFLVPRMDVGDPPSSVGGAATTTLGERGNLAEALAERVVVLLRDPELRARMGVAARRRVRDRFSAQAAARETLAAYERCLAEVRGGTGLRAPRPGGDARGGS